MCVCVYVCVHSTAVVHELFLLQLATVYPTMNVLSFTSVILKHGMHFTLSENRYEIHPGIAFI